MSEKELNTNSDNSSNINHPNNAIEREGNESYD